ncbi:tRNA (N(6)-L-threonylcarbamoyladenosine(37)-C(2))-methylthiotransferase [Nanoarchaeota archaeon]
MVKVYIETVGCAHNFADSEHMAGLLAQAGYELVENENKADLIIFNTCTVKTPTEHAFFNRLEEVKKKKKKIVIAGCIPQTEPGRLLDYSLIGTHQIDKITEVVAATLKDKRKAAIFKNRQTPLILPKIRKNPIVEIIPINTGCLGKCTYCKTKAARGHLVSYPPEQILQKARESLNDGIKEIWLTSQDTACYGQDIGVDLIHLVNEISKIEKDFKIRIGMGNPDHFLGMEEKLIKAMQNEKVYKFLHIPVQSGSDSILTRMERNYTIKQYKKIVTKLKNELPKITIATDVICGFPGETERQFDETIKLIKQTRPDIVNVSRFWKRERTLAAEMPKQLPDKTIMRRSEKLSKIARQISLENKKEWIGWQGEVIINEKGKNKQQWKARTPSYTQITIKGKFKLGQKVKVKIKSSTIHDLIAEKI